MRQVMFAGFAAAAEIAFAATVSDKTVEMDTYPFSDPDPVPCTAERRYPYFRYDGSAAKPVRRAWRMLELDNGRISVSVAPECGGKVWGARDAKTGVDFVYRNPVAKFRDISLRGPWTSGGIEYNFGIIGHAPSCSTPVDCFVRTNADSSVSCFLAANEHVTRTWWQVEVRLADGADEFETRTVWFNASGLPRPCYHWMNAAFSAEGSPLFLFPGDSYIGHEGDRHSWPYDADGHRLDAYLGNAFGGHKSYHVLPGDAETFGLWWPDLGVGAVHRTEPWRKYGRKLWLWSLSRQGGIWEDLLTDGGGQYAELQSGRNFNQPHHDTYRTPFKHPVFDPGATETYCERWGVLRSKDAVGKANPVPTQRPDVAPRTFDWNSPNGRCMRGFQHLRERSEAEAEKCFKDALAADPHLSAAMCGLAEIELWRGEYAACHALCRRALAIDAYDATASYFDGLAFFAEGDMASARDRLGVAAFDRRNRSAAYALIARSYLREGNSAEAKKAADLSLEANAANLDAILARLVALRGTPRAASVAREALEKYPLFHAARYELEGSGFARLVTCELPHEALEEIALWYAETGLKNDALAILRLAGRAVMPRIVAAYIAGDKSALSDIASLPAAHVFPFRREELPTLRWAAEENASWKFKYWLAVALASFHLDARADVLLDGCGNDPDEAVFYMYRARRRHGAERLADLRRAQDMGDSWRTGRDMCAYFEAAKNWKEMLAAAERYDAAFPGNNAVEIARAVALVRSGKPKDAMDCLKKTIVLPSESGGRAASVWHEAQDALGLERTWPENLGAGRPYPEDPAKDRRARVAKLKITRDIPYGNGALQKGDLYLPPKAGKDTPVVLCIHGGGWVAGDRQSWAGVAEFFAADLGFAAFNVEYALAKEGTRWPACGNDCVAAAKWLLSDDGSKATGLAPEKIWICGGSSGGHLSLWTLVNLPANAVAGVVSISGIGRPDDDCRLHPSRYAALFGRKPSVKDLRSMDPCAFAKPGMAPVLCTHAAVDTVVPISTHKAFAKAWRAAGNECEFVEYPCDVQRGLYGHCIWTPNTEPRRLIPALEAAIRDFVRKHGATSF